MRWARWGIGTAALAVAACGRGPTSMRDEAVGLVLLAGDNQVQYVARPVLRQPAVALIDAGGARVRASGVPVRWTVVEGDGTAESVGDTTDAAGVVRARWTLGPLPGDNTLRAEADRGDPVVFTARGTRPGPILFVSNRRSQIEGDPFEGYPGDLFTTTEDGGEVVRVVTPRGGVDYAADPSWAPGGGTILFTRFDPRPAGGTPGLVPLGIYRLAATGFEERQIPAAGNPPAVDSLRHPNAGPSSLARVYVHALFDRQLYRMENQGLTLRAMTSGWRSAHSPAISPDGTRLAFACSSGASVAHICTVAPSGGPVTQITRGRTVDGEPDWSPDGTQILFSRDSLAEGGVWIVQSDGTGARQILPGHVTSPSWAPDGRRFAAAITTAGRSDIHVVDVTTGTSTNITNTRWSDRQPTWRRQDG